MRKLLSFLFALAVTVGVSAGAWGQVGIGVQPNFSQLQPASGGGCSAILALDGTPVRTNGATTTFTLPVFSTTKTNDVIILGLLVQANSNPTITVSSPTLGTFTQRAVANNGAVNQVWEFAAVSTGILTSEVVTVTLTAGPTYFYSSAQLFAVNGATVTSVAAAFDGGGPQVGNSSTAPALTTAFANTMPVAVLTLASDTGTAGSGWTLITGGGSGDFLMTEYQIVTGATGTFTGTMTGDTQNAGGIIDAVKRSC